MTTTTITAQIGERAETFVLFQTDAPKEYDHGDAIELYDGSYNDNGTRKVERYVLIPEGDVEWQRGRNFSGLHSMVTDDLLMDEKDLSRVLWKRLYGRTETL